MIYAQPTYYREIFFKMQEFGLFDVFLPFMLIFSLTYLIAQSLPHIKNKEAGIFALVVSLGAIATHVTGLGGTKFDVVDFINGIIPGLTGIVIGVIGFFFVLAVVAPKYIRDIKESKISPPSLIIIIALILATYIIVQQTGLVSPNSSISLGVMGSWLADPENATWVVMLIVFAATIWFVTKGEKKSEEGEEGKKGKAWSDILKNLFLGHKY